MKGADFSRLPGMRLAGDEPVFAEPWEAQAFAMALALHQQGVFTWQEWADVLSQEIHRMDTEPLPYYRHWLNALEKILIDKNITHAVEIDTRTEAWHEAAARTPHGQPIVL